MSLLTVSLFIGFRPHCFLTEPVFSLTHTLLSLCPHYSRGLLRNRSSPYLPRCPFGCSFLLGFISPIMALFLLNRDTFSDAVLLSPNVPNGPGLVYYSVRSRPQKLQKALFWPTLYVCIISLISLNF